MAEDTDGLVARAIESVLDQVPGSIDTSVPEGGTAKLQPWAETAAPVGRNKRPLEELLGELAERVAADPQARATLPRTRHPALAFFDRFGRGSGGRADQGAAPAEGAAGGGGGAVVEGPALGRLRSRPPSRPRRPGRRAAGRAAGGAPAEAAVAALQAAVRPDRRAPAPRVRTTRQRLASRARPARVAGGVADVAAGVGTGPPRGERRAPGS